MSIGELIKSPLVDLIPLLPFLIWFVTAQAKTHKSLRELQRKIDVAIIQSGIATAWASKEPPFLEAVSAILTNINLGANGNHSSRLVELVCDFGTKLDDSLKTYRSILSAFVLNHKCTAYFLTTIAQVDEELNKRRMERRD